MGILNVVVKHDGTDISNSTISYNREHDICSGVGTLELLVPLNISRTIKPWDVIEIWENGNKKAKFYVDSTSEDAAAGIIRIKATDGSKKLTDYFIVDSYTVDYLSYGRYWIEKFLTEAGISYTFTVTGNGSPLSNNTGLGFDSAFNTITTLLQQSGWYIYFNNNGTAIIGDLNKDVNDPDHSIDSGDISVVARELDDERLRNRAVVWGNTNPTYGNVFVDISVPTPWNYDSLDKRAVVLSNSSIYSNDQALSLAQMMLKEFTQIKDEKTLLVVNDYNLQLGEILKVTTKYWAGRGLITGLTATMDRNGLVYEVVINKKCPRLFTFFSNFPPTEEGFYVYIGTAGDGIWRKYVTSSTWGNDSSGLEDLNIKDLAIRNGNFATIAEDGFLYTRSSELASWSKYTPPNLRDVSGVTYSNMDLRAVACSTDMNDNIVVGYNYVPSGIMASGVVGSGMSWVLQLTGAQTLVRAEQVVISGGAGPDNNIYSIYDLESTGEYNIISVSGIAPASGYIAQGVDEYLRRGAGYRTVSMSSFNAAVPPDSKCLNRGFGYGDTPSSEVLYVPNVALTYKSSLICDPDGYTFWYTGWKSGVGYLCKTDMNALSASYWTFTPPAEWTAAGFDEVEFLIRHKTTNTFDIVAIVSDTTMYHYSYTIGDSTLTSLSNSAKAPGSAYGGAGLIGGQVIMGYWFSNTVHAKILNLTSSTYSDVDVYTGMGAGYSGLNGGVSLFSTGDSIIWGLTYIVGTDLYDFPHCPIGPATKPKTAELWAVGYRITDYGGSGIIGPTLIKSIPTYDGSEGWGDETTHYIYFNGFTEVNMTSVAVNTNLRSAYVITPVNVLQQPCSTASYPHFDEAYSMVIQWTSMSINYEKWTGYIREDLGYTPEDGGLDWFQKDPEDISIGGAGISFTGSVGRYTSPGWTMHGHIGGIFANDYWKIFRNAPAFAAGFGFDYFSDFLDCADFGVEIAAQGTMDDLTGQLAAGAPGGYVGTYLVEFPRWDWECPYPTRVAIPTNSYVWLTQIYGVYRGYSIFKLGKALYDDFPMGTILKHTSTTEIGDKITATDESLEQTLGIFEVIKTTQYPCKVDIAQGAPTVIYNIPPDDGTTSIDFAATIQNEEDTFYTHADPKPVFESRVFSLPKPGTFPTISGTFNPKDYERYVGISNREGILASEYYLDTPWVNMVTVASGVAVSGLITHFETTNYVPEGTYFFYTVSGVKSFYQKDPESSYWQDFSATLPDAPITIIRVDDYI